MRRRAPRTSECARALWLLGLQPPVDPDELAAAWKRRVARAHPDLHAVSEQRSEAATVLTRALNDARDTLQSLDRERPRVAAARHGRTHRAGSARPTA